MLETYLRYVDTLMDGIIRQSQLVTDFENGRTKYQDMFYIKQGFSAWFMGLSLSDWNSLYQGYPTPDDGTVLSDGFLYGNVYMIDCKPVALGCFSYAGRELFVPIEFIGFVAEA